jgi:hypothetical protein
MVATLRFAAGALQVTCDGSTTVVPANRPAYCGITPWETNRCVIGSCN